ncbi:MAG TPA: YciI family protein [Polyangiaceae bacterium]|nr:YciI family protein [Polyangiaceae bacterium]
MKFMLMMHAPRGTGEYQISQWKPEEFQAHIRFMKDLNRELREAGELVGAEGLAPPGQARIVRSKGEGAPEVTDGPFAETKEFLVGYWIVDVETAERAYAIAGKASTAPGPGGTPLGIRIEVRQVMSPPPDSL